MSCSLLLQLEKLRLRAHVELPLSNPWGCTLPT